MQRIRASQFLTAGAVTFAAYVLIHPRGDVEGAADVEQAVHSMAVESTWVGSHLVGLAAVLMIGIGLTALLRGGWLASEPRPRRAAWLVVAGSVAATLELVPHTLVATEATGGAGSSTLLTDLHVLFQATLLPVYGLGIAALALAGFGRVAHPIACLLGVVGGVALTVVGPLLLITDDPAFGVVFMPGAGSFVFLIAVGLRLIRRSGQPAPTATRVATSVG